MSVLPQYADKLAIRAVLDDCAFVTAGTGVFFLPHDSIDVEDNGEADKNKDEYEKVILRSIEKPFNLHRILLSFLRRIPNPGQSILG